MAEGDNKVHVTLHWLDQSRSQRLVWLLQECKGISWDVSVYKRQPDRLAPPSLKKVHPLGKSPVITVSSGKDETVIAESGAITEFLCEYYAPHLIPKRYEEGRDGDPCGETESWRRYRFYMHYAEGSLMTLLILSMFMNILSGPNVPFLVRPVARTLTGRVESSYLNPNFETHWLFLNSQLASSPGGGLFLCGPELTAADIMMSFPIIISEDKIDKAKYPKLAAYADMLKNHIRYRQSVEEMENRTGQPLKAAL
ncbi:hypothetical protein K470DRAFT_282210 [Piedraia hortae CBS 480.64]|uniref:GST N-terminal domain-containing protein n=1 Tax=Piedraia hortae CBS 480.64 TaxID=1314780 RepID=A0A6A7BZT7_9PEZI|nr:hypothetical protein K470DRAFT_282210 [Piedraia hortae CBS 480.64]